MRLSWLWPAVIILSALAAGLATLIIPGTIVGTIVIMWFFFVCPGMVLVRALDINKPSIEWTLALALSLAIDAIVAGILLYAGRWSPTGTLDILIGLCLSGAIIQLISKSSATAMAAKQLAILHPSRSSALFAILLTLFVSVGLALGLWSYGVYSSSHSAKRTSVVVREATPHASSASTTVPTPTPSPTTLLSTSYYGTIYNVATNLTTKMSLTDIQQGSMSGHFTGLSLSGSFTGSIDASRHIHFIVTDATGQAVLSFDGAMRADGNLAGNYCGLDQEGQCGGQYGFGLWSATPVQ